MLSNGGCGRGGSMPAYVFAKGTKVSRAHSALWEWVWDMTIEWLVAQKFYWLCIPAMTLATTKVRLATLLHL